MKSKTIVAKRAICMVSALHFSPFGEMDERELTKLIKCPPSSMHMIAILKP